MKILGKELTFNGNKVYHAGNKPTASEIGAAASSHTHNYAGSSSVGGAANSAIKATQDSTGQEINTTYIKGLSVNGRTITYTKGNGTTGTITTQDTNTTYSTGTSSALGLTKLYTGTGNATDGTMTQSAITAELNKTARIMDGNISNIYTWSGEYIANNYLTYNDTAAAAKVVKDSHDNSNLTISYMKSAMTSSSWIAAWNGKELGTISPLNLRTTIQAAPDNLSRGLEKTITVNGDADTYYPVLITTTSSNFSMIEFTVSRRYNETAPDSWNTPTHRGGLTFGFRWNGDPYWGGNGAGDYQILWLHETYCTMVQNIQPATTGMVVWLRGGGAVYHITCSQGNNFTATVNLSSFTDGADRTFSPTATVGNRNNILQRWTARQSQVFDGGNRVYSPSNAPNLGSLANGGTFIGEAKFSNNGNWNDPWYGVETALKVSGKAAFSDTIRIKDVHILGHNNSKTAVMSTYTNPDRVEFFWSETPGKEDWSWSNKCYIDANGVIYASKQVSVGGHKINPYSGNGVSIIRPDGQEFSGLEIKELWIGPYSGATKRLSMSSSAPSSPNVGDVWIQN